MLERFADGATRWVGSTTSIILHTIFFVVIFGLLIVGVELDTILLVLTTAVSLEAIYLALFIQRSVNINTVTLEEAAEDIQGIEEDIEDISEDVEDISEDIEGLEKDIEGIEKDIDEIGEDVEDLAGSGEEEVDSYSDIDQLKRDLAELHTIVETMTKKLDAVNKRNG